MAEQSLKPIIDKLENLFSKFNEKFYNGELQAPVITVSPDTTKGAMGGVPLGRRGALANRKKLLTLQP